MKVCVYYKRLDETLIDIDEDIVKGNSDDFEDEVIKAVKAKDKQFLEMDSVYDLEGNILLEW